MRQFHKNVCVTLLLVLGGMLLAAQEQQQQKEVDIDELAVKEAERLASLLQLEDWQLFYADSIFRHDYGKMQEEIKELQAKRISQTEAYQDVQDKWMSRTDEALKKVFDAAQWKKYLKDGAGRRMREREKRQKARNQ